MYLLNIRMFYGKIIIPVTKQQTDMLLTLGAPQPDASCVGFSVGLSMTTACDMSSWEPLNHVVELIMANQTTPPNVSPLRNKGLIRPY